MVAPWESYQEFAGPPVSRMASSESIGQIMISYQWDYQTEAIRIKETLEEQGYKVWIDIDKMSGNIYTKMSEAVETSDLLIVCMSSKYETSENCNRELQYAQDLRKKIVPIKIEKDYKPHGPLGLIVSGALYVDFSDPSQFHEKVKKLVAEMESKFEGHDVIQRKYDTSKGIEFTSHVPSQVNQFIGRDKDIQNILQDLQSNQLVLITGSPGIGKTGLAIEVAHQLQEKNSSSIIDFIDLRSIHSVETIISTILLAFSKTADDKPVEMLQNVLKSIKSEVVLIFDNTEDALTDNLKDKFLSVMKELLVKSSNLKLLCTSRVKFYLLGVNCKEEILQALEMDNALSVIRAVLPDMCDEDARKLMDVCGCAPLALWIVTNLIKDGGYSPESVIKEISLNAAKPMDGYYLEYLPENCQLEACINSSYVRLTTEMQNAFCCLSIFPSTFDIEAAKAILNVPNTEHILAGLKLRSLLSYDPATNLYSLHPYMRAFAKSRKEYSHQNTRVRFEMHYIEKLLVLTETFFSKAFAVAVREIRKEQANMTEMLTLITKDKELYKTYRQLASRLISRFIYMFISVECYVSFYTELLETATKKKDTRTQALVHFCLAYHYRYIEQFEKAIDMFTVAFSKYGRWGPDKFFIPTCHSNIAYCHCKLREDEEATEHVKKSEKFLSQRKDEKQSLSMALLLSSTASPLHRIEHYEESIKAGLAALLLFKDVLGNHLDTARELHGMGVCYSRYATSKDQKDKQRLGLMEESLKYSIQAGQIYENVIGNNSETAESMFLSGLMSFRLQKFQQSSDFFKKSVEINEVLYGPESEKVTKAKYIKEMADNSLAVENMRLMTVNKT